LFVVNLEKSLVQVKGNLYRHTNGTLPALHSGLVLITKEGAIVIDPVLTQAAIWLNAEFKKRFNVSVKYVILTHGHYDHTGGSQIFQQAGAKVIIQKNGLEAIVGEKLPVAVPDIVFDEQLTITLGGETVVLSHIAPSHSNSMAVVTFPGYKAMQLTDIGESDTMPYNDFLDFYYDGWIKTLDWALKQDARCKLYRCWTLYASDSREHKRLERIHDFFTQSGIVIGSSRPKLGSVIPQR
jgi:glyoxylase-like metal-dependent hydrolase (beta-lactamase superfamily II)